MTRFFIPANNLSYHRLSIAVISMLKFPKQLQFVDGRQVVDGARAIGGVIDSVDRPRPSQSIVSSFAVHPTRTTFNQGVTIGAANRVISKTWLIEAARPHHLFK